MILAHRNHIFVKPIEEKHSRLILPPMFKKAMDTVQRGVVIAAGPKSHVNAGETIVFDKWQDNSIQLNGDKLLMIKPNHVIVVEK